MTEESAARIAALEAELGRVRAEAEAERERFERRLKLAQSALPERRDPRTVAQNIAAQQEIEALRGALRERDRVVKELNGQVRGLEDQLEDHYRQTESLRRRIDQRDAELADARRQSELAARRAASPSQPRLQQPPPPAQRPTPTVRQPVPMAAPRSSAPASPARADALVFVLGLVVGTLLTCAIAVGLWWTGNWPAAPATAGAEPIAAAHGIAGMTDPRHAG